eukprot:g15929.t1
MATSSKIPFIFARFI